MGIFNFKKKKDPEYDPTNLKLYDMKTGSVFDYNLSNWAVLRTFEYQWDGGEYSLEFEIDNGQEHRFLSVEKDDNELFIILMEKIKIRQVDENLPEFIQRNDTPPKNLEYNGDHFFLDSDSEGLCREEGSDVTEEFLSWDFYTKDETKVLSIEQWGTNEFEAYCGIVAKEYEFSNILPGK